MTAAESAPSPGPDPSLPPVAYARMTFLLRGGLLLALAVLAVTLLVYLAEHPGASAGVAIGANPIVQYLNLPALASGLAHGAPEAYLTLGLLILLATPILRVASGLYYFSRARDGGMTAITLVVLALLLFGVLILGPIVR